MKALAAARLVAITAALAIAGCASFNGGGLVPGKSTEANVLDLMGEPSQRLSLAVGLARKIDRAAAFRQRQPLGRLSHQGQDICLRRFPRHKAAAVERCAT